MRAAGSFGRVMLAKNKRSGEFFAMKRLKKSDIIKLRQVDHVISENTILADIDHPFLVSYRSEIEESTAGSGSDEKSSAACKHVRAKPCTIIIYFAIGRASGVLTGLPLPLLLDAVHSWWRAIYLP